MPLHLEFKELPTLRSMMLKAAFAKGSGANTLPEMSRTINSIDVSAAHLKAYNRVCGFADRAILPPTYLHMFAYPMFMHMLIDDAFPFKVLGLVHVRNSITQHRPVRCSELVDMHCKMTNLQEVDKGYEFDVLVEAKVQDELVWSSVITNIARARTKSAKDSQKKKHEQPDWDDWNQMSFEAPADIGRRYAKVSGDYNLIHLYPVTAKLLGFKAAIAHGMWTKAMALSSLSGVYKDAEQFSVDVKFKLPNFLPAKMNLFHKSDDANTDFWVRTQRADKPIAEGKILLIK